MIMGRCKIAERDAATPRLLSLSQSLVAVRWGTTENSHRLLQRAAAAWSESRRIGVPPKIVPPLHLNARRAKHGVRLQDAATSSCRERNDGRGTTKDTKGTKEYRNARYEFETDTKKLKKLKKLKRKLVGLPSAL